MKEGSKERAPLDSRHSPAQWERSAHTEDGHCHDDREERQMDKLLKKGSPQRKKIIVINYILLGHLKGKLMFGNSYKNRINHQLSHKNRTTEIFEPGGSHLSFCTQDTEVGGLVWVWSQLEQHSEKTKNYYCGKKDGGGLMEGESVTAAGHRSEPWGSFPLPWWQKRHCCSWLK